MIVVKCFGILSPESFTNVVLRRPDGSEEKLGYNRSLRDHPEIYDNAVDVLRLTRKAP